MTTLACPWPRQLLGSSANLVKTVEEPQDLVLSKHGGTPAVVWRGSASPNLRKSPVWPTSMLRYGPPVVHARPTLPTSTGRLEVGCAGEERRWICSRSYG